MFRFDMKNSLESIMQVYFILIAVLVKDPRCFHAYHSLSPADFFKAG